MHFVLFLLLVATAPSRLLHALPNDFQVYVEKNIEDDAGLFFLTEKMVARDPKTLLAENKIALNDDGLELVASRGSIQTPKKVPQKKIHNKKVPFAKHRKIEDIFEQKIKSPFFSIEKNNGEFIISGKYRPELFYGKNLTLLNGCNAFDQIFFIRHTIDITMDAKCGSRANGYDVSHLKFTLRNKGVWGNSASIFPTSEVTVKDIDAKFGAHSHSLPRHVFWARELWLKTKLNAIFGDWIGHNKHYFILGLYPFKLGHGISLGDAYAVNPGLLGFYTENVVDQYAPGALLTGEIIQDQMKYDLYAAILENKSDSVKSNVEPVYAQRYGHRNRPQRGFGSINWLVAARLMWLAWDSKTYGKAEFEPYVLYNRAPEQRIEFQGDAATSLATLGMSADYKRGNFEMSGEAAKNFGAQSVRGWDRNRIITQLDPTSAAVLHVNSHVLNAGTNNNALDTKANQAIINSSIQAQAQNGQLIGGGLQNANNRFNDPFNTPFKGWMAILDAGYWMYDRQLQIAAAAGIASGDENPNINLDDPKSTPGDGDYDGFIGLQETFNINRVESAYFLGQRRIARPLSLPNDAIQNGSFASTINEFTNLKYIGFGLHVKPDWERKPYWRPNIIFFWQEDATRAFDCRTKMRSNKCASNFLGTEVNSFFNILFADCIGATLVAAIFIPGSHYSDIKGTPINEEQLRLLASGSVETASQLLISNDPAFSIDFMLEYKF